MNKISILTLFPNFFINFLDDFIIKRGIKNKKIKIEIINFRDFSTDKKKHVDGYQVGGGPGMVISMQPIIDCLKKIKKPNTHTILLSPQGSCYDQKKCTELLKFNNLILICGHYEGFDERILNYVDEIISIGDYILSGGEIAAMVIVNTISRLIDNSINPNSLDIESFDNFLLDYPIYTKPIKFESYNIPKILLSGNHQAINDWRNKQRIKKTKKYRPDLYKKYLKSLKNKRGNHNGN